MTACNLTPVVPLSYGKSMGGLYGERIGVIDTCCMLIGNPKAVFDSLE